MSVCVRCAKRLQTLYVIGFRSLSTGGSTGSLRQCEARSSPRPSDSAGSEEFTQSRGDGEAGSGPGGDSEDDIRQKVLEGALQYVPQHGWSRDALTAGAQVVGLPGVAHGLFPRGGIELISYFYTSCNDQLSQQMEQQKAHEEQDGGEKKKTSEFIRGALISRLSMIDPYIEQWPQALAMMALPQNAPESWRNLVQLADDIWHHTGDTAVDVSWYTKRLSLAAVYKSSEIFMIQDRSGDYSDTWGFLDRRLQDVVLVGKTVSKAQNTGDVMLEGLQAAFHVGRNVLGMNSRQR